MLALVSFVALALVSPLAGIAIQPVNVTAFQLTPKIVGGAPANIEQFPYQAVLLYEGRYLCGAAILAQTKIITAAHCVFKINAVRKLQVRVGSSSPLSGGVVKTALKIDEHHGFDPQSMNNDIAIVTLADPLTFNSAVRPIKIATSSGALTPGAPMIVSGYGAMSSGSDAASNLHAVSVPVVDQKTCVKAYKSYKGPARPTDLMFCAGFYKTGGKDACKGDSGGSFQISSSDLNFD